MNKILKSITAVALSILASTAVAQTAGTESTTGNLVYTTVNPAPTGAMPHSWSGFNIVNSTGGNTTGDNGAVTGYNSSTGTFMFGYNQGTIAYTYAINQALANSGTGIQVRGYNWSWEINNNNFDNRQGSTDTLTARILTYAPNNVDLRRVDSWTYNTRFDWTTFSGTVNYNNPGAPSEFGNMQIEFSGRDSGFWAGYYGPMVRNIDVRLRYGVDECVTNPQSSPSCPNYRTYYTFGDDTYAHVPLPFTFPFYGRTFTNSWMHSNGVVSFLDPMSPIEGAGYNPGAWAYCCSGPDLSQNTVGYGAQFNYTIAPFWTDLYPNANSRFYTTKSSTNIKYHWDNVADISNGANLNTFNLELRPSGYIGASYGATNSQQQVTIGTIGDLRLGEKTHQFFGIPGVNNIANWSLNATQAADCSNPLNNPYCPGYAEAFLQQQCSINALYNPSCPGYAAAYFTQQCTANPLYNVSCPGYATAYYDYQCSVNPLYHTGCPGYEQAYFNQQCTANPLYNSGCPGYDTAYFNQQCGLNPLYNTTCPGYADAYYVQQCTANPLYDVGCTGYATAYFNQQCSISPLYNNQCPGYAEAYFSQQCSLDGLYNTQCPNYAEAYAKKNILNVGNTSPTTTTPAPATVVTTTSDPVASAAPVIADPVVNQAVTSTATSASPAQAATATVPLVQAPAATTTTTAVAAASTETKKEEAKKEEAKKDEAKAETSTSTSTTAASPSNNTKDQPKTTRQALAERRLEAARAKAIEDGKQLAGKMGEAASLEAQAQIQGVVVAAMGFVPGFDRYGQVTLPDVAGYKPFEIYRGQRNVDNPAGRRFLTGADARHQEMVDQQYTRSK